jgi:outer membrane protein OmpA-like peptidoglycan-associated protein
MKRLTLRTVLIGLLCSCSSHPVSHRNSSPDIESICTEFSDQGCRFVIPLTDRSDIEAMFDSTKLKQLEQLSSYLKFHFSQKIQVQGHVYSSGNEESNLERGERIVKFVAHKIKGYGVNPSQLDTISFGSAFLNFQRPIKGSNPRVVILLPGGDSID